jgi:hypothetical protein
MNWSSEAHKAGIVPPKPIEDMTDAEFTVWRNSLDPDAMGFDGAESPAEEESWESLQN